MSNFYLRVSSKHVKLLPYLLPSRFFETRTVGAFRRLQTKGLRPLVQMSSFYLRVSSIGPWYKLAPSEFRRRRLKFLPSFVLQNFIRKRPSPYTGYRQSDPTEAAGHTRSHGNNLRNPAGGRPPKPHKARPGGRTCFFDFTSNFGAYACVQGPWYRIAPSGASKCPYATFRWPKFEEFWNQTKVNRRILHHRSVVFIRSGHTVSFFLYHSGRDRKAMTESCEGKGNLCYEAGKSATCMA
jgi:hypothetical protein